jgi:hypothetical protein
MSQTIHCISCDADSVARGVTDLIDRHTNEHGRFCCARCGGTDTFLETQRRPRDPRQMWFRGIVPIGTIRGDASYAPFVFLAADEPDGDITGIAFRYYRPDRSNGTKLNARRHKLGGGPLMTQSQFLSLVARLAKIGVVSKQDWRAFVQAGAGQAG